MKNLVAAFVLVLLPTVSHASPSPGATPPNVRWSAICNGYLETVEAAGPLTVPTKSAAALEQVINDLDDGLADAAAKHGRGTVWQRLKEFLSIPFRIKSSQLQNFRTENAGSNDLSIEQMYVQQRIVDSIVELQRDMSQLSDREMLVRRNKVGREGVTEYVDRLIQAAREGELNVRERIKDRLEALDARNDESAMKAHQRTRELNERKNAELQPEAGEGRFGRAFRTKWFGPSSKLSDKDKAKIFAGYGATALTASALSAFFSPLVAPVAIGGVALGGWFGVRYHLYHLIEKAAVNVRASLDHLNWRYRERPRAERALDAAPSGEAWLADLEELKAFAQRTDVPKGVVYLTREIDLPLNFKLIGREMQLEFGAIREASIRGNPSRWFARRARLAHVLKFNADNVPELTTTVTEIPNDALHPDFTRGGLGFALMILVTPR